MTRMTSIPPFVVTPKALSLVSEIMRFIGRYEGLLSPKPQPKLRRTNQIRTILGSLAIEGNTLTLEQATALFDGRHVHGPKTEILEVENAIRVYERAHRFKAWRVRDFLRAHGALMAGLAADAERFRTGNVGILRGKKVAHVAPPAKEVPRLVAQLLRFLERDKETPVLVASAVVHYEIEFIHPFSDGNGRMGRLWQHVMLTAFHPVFSYLPFESVIHARQAEYYRVLSACDQAGNSTKFIEFALVSILESLDAFLRDLRPGATSAKDRIERASVEFRTQSFSRKDYLALFKTLSTATASRDLKMALEARTIAKSGNKALARYRFR